jgi:CheY-like chemotaxis protein
MQAEQPRRVLVIEDNPTDVGLIKEALTAHGVQFDMTVLRDGEAALKYLQNIGDASPRPELIIIDVNIPKHDGIEVLVQYRMSVALFSVPMIVLTSSNSPSDHQRTKTLGVSAFIRKPLNLSDFVALGKRFKEVLETPYVYQGPRS